MKRVSILIESSSAYGRELLRGITRYHQEKGHWSINYEPMGLQKHIPKFMQGLECDGILARITSPQILNELIEIGKPFIDLSGTQLEGEFPFYGVDNHTVASLAVEHFLEKSFENFAFVGPAEVFHSHMHERYVTYKEILSAKGHIVHAFRKLYFNRENVSLARQRNEMKKWIQKLPRPIALFCGDDSIAREVLNTIAELELSVPQTMAVLGCNNDELICPLSTPSLSSVQVDAHVTGYEAAAELEKLMKGKKLVRKEKLFPARGVCARESTDVMMIKDSDVLQVLQFIRENYLRQFTIDEAIRDIKTCRSLVERKFKKMVSRTIRQEITRYRIEKAKDFLLRKQLSLEETAEVMDYPSVNYFSYVFKKETGEAPGTWRKKRLTG